MDHTPPIEKFDRTEEHVEMAYQARLRRDQIKHYLFRYRETHPNYSGPVYHW